ncbi:MAG: hypoxanthine phosphoribosyltransferase [Bacteroidota bacterium]
MKVKDKDFQLFIDHQHIAGRINELAAAINKDYEGKTPLFIAILNGSFIFAADLIRAISVPSQISFVKVTSYDEMESTGNVKSLIGLNENIFNRDVIIIEDIIDTGRTISKMVEEFNSLGTKSLEIVSLLVKNKERSQNTAIKYTGFEIPEEFVVGYGLDYDGYGRNLKDIYQYKPHS